ncbi:ABC transporter substrate-binding protein [Nocardioides rubriscoriae]|uniref:ABC transporter substrate-binding protein n=1 Tax=Nocardioides rubriscoriae TaxID=642762 RepID=UPI0011E06B8B|nr:ABC transporter substrate-binding protein [Nocardioides rubriscoriae]
MVGPAGVRRRRVARVALLVAVLLGPVAGCGSSLDPQDVAGLDGGGVQTAGDGGAGDATDDGLGAAPAAPGDGADGGPAPVAPDGSDGPGAAPAAPGSAPDDGAGGGGDASAPPAVDPDRAGDCTGFRNGPGITDDTITIGNSSDISGPVPGLFEASRDATAAFVAYFNAANPEGICGRRLVLRTYDSRTDAAADQQAYAAACGEVFAMVGSMSAFNSGGAKTAEECGLPDIRSANVTPERNDCATCFGAQSTRTGEVANATADFILEQYGDTAKRSAFLYVNAGAAAANAPRQAKAFEKRGLDFEVVRGIETSEFNYTPYVQELKDEDIKTVFFTGATSMSVRLRQTMQQQGYEPVVYMREPTDYNRTYVETGGSAVDGTVIYTNFTPFEEAGRNPELSLYLSYLEQVRPGAEPGFFGVFSWSAARLFVEKATALGGRLTRASLVSALRATTSWTANGLHSPQRPGPHRTGECFRFLRLDGRTWRPFGGTAYRCDGTSFG